MSYGCTSLGAAASRAAFIADRLATQASSPWITALNRRTTLPMTMTATPYPPPSRMKIATTDMTIPVVNVPTERDVSHRRHPSSGKSWLPQAACGGNFKHRTVPTPIKTVAKSAVTCASLGGMPEPYEAPTPSLLRHAEIPNSDTNTDKES